MLYQIEQIAREEKMSAIERVRLRKATAAPIYYRLMEWVREEQANNLSLGKIGKAPAVLTIGHLANIYHGFK